MRNLIYIYSNFLTKKKKYYFLKYYTKAVKFKKLKLCTCQYSTYENDLEPIYTSYPKTNRNFNLSTSTDYLKLNNNKINKISNFIINKENSNIYSNFINLNKSEYFYNGNEIGSFSSYNVNNKNPTKNIISVKNGSNNKKYVVKIKLYGNQVEPIETENNSIKYKKYTNNNKQKKYVKNIFSYKNNNNKNTHCNYYLMNKTRKSQGLLTDRIYTNDNEHNEQTLNPIDRIKIKNIETNNRIMNDQEILDYLNTNNNEKKNLIKKILKQKLNDINIIPNKKKIQLNTCKSYSYINNNYNNNYNYYNDRKTTPFNTNIPIKKKRNNISYKYYDNEIVDIISREKENNGKIIINKKHSLRPCCSNEVIFYRNYNNYKEEEEKNYLSTNQHNNRVNKKKLKINNSLNNLENNKEINNMPNISITSSFPNKIKNVLSPSPRIILLNQKNKLKFSESTNKLIKRKKQFYQNNINNNNKNIVQKKEIPKNIKIKIPTSSHHIKANSLDNNIKDKNNKIKLFLLNKVVNEQFNKEINNNKKEVSMSESENLELSVQSVNDSKLMELARNYIKQEDNLNRNEIKQILNSKKNFV